MTKADNGGLSSRHPASRVEGRRGTRRLARLLPPPPQTERADFPHSAFLPTSRQRLCDLSGGRDCWAIRPHAIVEEDPHHARDLEPAPSIPPEAPTLPVPKPVPPQFALDPVADERKTPTGLPDRKVGHPTTQHRVDALHHPTTPQPEHCPRLRAGWTATEGHPAGAARPRAPLAAHSARRSEHPHTVVAAKVLASLNHPNIGAGMLSAVVPHCQGRVSDILHATMVPLGIRIGSA